ncbi:hypothetical protein, partial [Aeromonas hydrophila]|uniref:hypothetical protein n=1 Tax=Aeromonas hydrophila TaxID=644 RepID=UPI0036DF6761
LKGERWDPAPASPECVVQCSSFLPRRGTRLAVYHGGYSNKAPESMQLIIAFILSAFYSNP